uniref:Uncharacterized protein n=1 Tax=uncultured organism TaxID=155900 RepID=D9ZDM2_9ZZZZ|nr:putative protein [uncultured organism]
MQFPDLFELHIVCILQKVTLPGCLDRNLGVHSGLVKLCGLYETEHGGVERLVNHIRYHMVPLPYYPAVPALELLHVSARRGIAAVSTYGEDRLNEVGEHA